MKNSNLRHVITSRFVGEWYSLLPACAPFDWFKTQMNGSTKATKASQETVADGSEVIATIAGKPGMTAKTNLKQTTKIL